MGEGRKEEEQGGKEKGEERKWEGEGRQEIGKKNKNINAHFIISVYTSINIFHMSVSLRILLRREHQKGFRYYHELKGLAEISAKLVKSVCTVKKWVSIVKR